MTVIASPVRFRVDNRAGRQREKDVRKSRVRKDAHKSRVRMDTRRRQPTKALDVLNAHRESCSMRVAELEQQQQQLQAEADVRLQVEVTRANAAEARLAAELEQRSRLREYLDVKSVAHTTVREDMAEDLHTWLFGRQSPAAVARRLRVLNKR